MNLFNPHRPNGSYKLDLSLYEEQMVAKILCDLARQEGMANMSEISFNGTAVEKMTPDFIRTNIKKEGIFDCTYVCPEDKQKDDLREQLGVKYLDWK